MMRLNWARYHNVGPFRDFTLDLDALGDARLVAITGQNGVGKTFALEGATFGAACRRMPTQGDLVKRASARDSFVESCITTDQKWIIRHELDATSSTGEVVVTDERGEPAFKGTGFKAFKRWAARHMPDPEVLSATQFSVQKSEGFIELGSAQRISVVLRARGVQKIERMAERARKYANEWREKLEIIEARIKDLQIPATDPVARGFIELELLSARERAERAHELLSAAKADLTSAEAEDRRIASLEADAERVEGERARVAGEVAERRARLIELEQRAAECRALLARAAEIRAAAERVLGLRVAVTEAAVERQTLTAKLEGLKAESRQVVKTTLAAAERERQERERRRRTVDRLHALDARIAETRAVLGDAEAIRQAAAEAAELRAEITRTERQAADLEREAARLSAEAEAVKRRGAEIKRLGERAAIRASRANGRLADAALIEAAGARLPALRAEVETARAEVATLEDTLETVRSVRLASAGEQNASLRHYLGSIAGATPAADLRGGFREIGLRYDELRGTAREALNVDDDAFKEAESVPKRASAVEAELRAARDRLNRMEAVLAEAERAAGRAAEIAAAREELAQAEAEVREAEQGAAAVRVELAALAERVRERAGAAMAALEAGEGVRMALAEVEPLAGRAEALARAETVLGELEAQRPTAASELDGVGLAIEAARFERETGEREAARLEAESRAAAQAHRLADERCSAAQAEARALEGVAVAEGELAGAAGRLAELDPQVEAARAELAAIEERLAGFPARAELPVRPNLVAIRYRIDEADLEARNAIGDRVRAEERLAQALELAGRLTALTTERAALALELADWTRIAIDLGRDGVQADEVDAAGPELTALTNDLLHTCFGSRYTVSIETFRLASNGKDTVDECRVEVIDTVKGREGESREFSGGERVILGEAIALALTMMACQCAGLEGVTLVRDESGAALDPENARAYVKMLRRAGEVVRAAHILVVSHDVAVQRLCDAQILVSNDVTEPRIDAAA